MGYEPPAGDPGVDDGESLFKHAAFGFVPAATKYVTLPPAPNPLSSPAPSIIVVPARSDGVQENPVPKVVSLVICPVGIEND